MLAYAFELVTLVSLFVLASISLNLIVGQAGMLSIGHGALIGIGAYAYAILTVTVDLHPLAALPGAVLATGIIGSALATLSVRLDEEQFSVMTLAFNLLTVIVLINWISLTNGDYGIAEIPRATFGFAEHSHLGFAIVAVTLTLLTYIVFQRISASGFGALLRASATDAAMVDALGSSVWWLRVKAFAISSAGGGLAGGLYAMHAGYIAPALFELHLSVLVLAMVVAGGGHSMRNAALGAIIITLIPEVLRFIAFDAASAGPLRQIIFGALIVLTVFWQLRPKRAAEAVT